MTQIAIAGVTGTFPVEGGHINISVNDLAACLRATWLNGVAARSAIGVPGLDPAKATWEKADWSYSAEGKTKWEKMAEALFPEASARDEGGPFAEFESDRFGYVRLRFANGTLERWYPSTQSWSLCTLPMNAFTNENLLKLSALLGEIYT